MKLKTYQLGILQGRAYRELEKELACVLYPHNLDIPEWKLLGILTDNPSIPPAEAAELLGTSRPFISTLLQHLEEKHLITRTSNSKDKRSVSLKITENGITVLAQVEADVKILLKELLHGINMLDAFVYHKVLQTIVSNSAKRKPAPKRSLIPSSVDTQSFTQKGGEI